MPKAKLKRGAAVRSTRWSDAVAQYFDWLNEEELMADAAGNRQYADAMARASSELGCLLIKHKIYREMKASNADIRRGG